MIWGKGEIIRDALLHAPRRVLLRDLVVEIGRGIRRRHESAVNFGRNARVLVDIAVRVLDFEHLVPRGLRFLARGTGTLETRSNDLLSLILFEKEYLRELLAIGERDAQAQIEELANFLLCGRSKS